MAGLDSDRALDGALPATAKRDDLDSEALHSVTKSRVCPGCGGAFQARRSTQRHCRSGCRVTALRQRRPSTKQPPEPVTADDIPWTSPPVRICESALGGLLPVALALLHQMQAEIDHLRARLDATPRQGTGQAEAQVAEEKKLIGRETETEKADTEGQGQGKT